MKILPRLALLGLVFALIIPGCASLPEGTLDAILNSGTAGGLDNETVVAGLKEALKVGTERTVSLTSARDGYLGNALIRIALPEQFESTASTMRDYGLGSYVDELETGMNRAAELAAGEATDVFWTAITQMTLADGFAILQGGDSAATDYFRQKTSATLEARFQPIVRNSMAEVGVANLYDQALTVYNRIPLVEKPEMVNLETYVTDRALGGLFTVLAQEEQKIREDPVARTTDLLKRVFGSPEAQGS